MVEVVSSIIHKTTFYNTFMHKHITNHHKVDFDSRNLGCSFFLCCWFSSSFIILVIGNRRIIFFFVTANNSEYDTYSYNKEYSSNDSNEFYIKFRASASFKRYICFLSHNLSPLKLLIYVLKRRNMHNYGTLRNKIIQEKYLYYTQRD